MIVNIGAHKIHHTSFEEPKCSVLGGFAIEAREREQIHLKHEVAIVEMLVALISLVEIAVTLRVGKYHLITAGRGIIHNAIEIERLLLPVALKQDVIIGHGHEITRFQHLLLIEIVDTILGRLVYLDTHSTLGNSTAQLSQRLGNCGGIILETAGGYMRSYNEMVNTHIIETTH